MLILSFPLTGQSGAILREVYTDISGSAVFDLTNSAKYIAGTPDVTNWVTDLFESPIDFGDYYGQRMHGVLFPPQSGWYTFWLASDDNSQLWLSTNESPAGLELIVDFPDWSYAREWSKSSIQQSDAVFLEVGKGYYIQALMKEGSQGDNLSVRWQMPNGVVEAPMTMEHIVPPGGPFVPPQLAAQTATNLAVTEGDSVELWVSVSNLWPVSFQWQRNGTNLPGATASNHAISAVSLAESNSPYRCILSNSLGVTTSATIALAVASDTDSPALAAVYNVGTTTVRVVFSEAVESNSATALANYRLTGADIGAAEFGADARTIVLSVSTLVYGSNYTLTVSNVLDRSAASNAILPGAPWTFTARAYSLQDIGTSSFAGTVAYLTNGLNMTAGGAGVAGLEDACTLNYFLQSGDFDVQVRVERLDLSDPWAMAGIMARSTLDADSPFAAVAATPSISGVSLQGRRAVGGNLLVNGDFESGREPGYTYPRYWYGWSDAVAQTNGETNLGGLGKPAPAGASDGTWMALMSLNPAATWNDWHGIGTWFPITPEERYVFSARYLIQSHLPAGHFTRMNLEWYDGLGGTEVGTRVLGPELSAQSTSWTPAEITGVAPAGATYAKAVFAYGDLDTRTNSPEEQFNAYWDAAAVRIGAGGAVESSGHFPVNYPNTWIRLQRQGDIFTALAGHDGSRWSVVSRMSNSLSSTVYLGLFATSHDDDETVTAAFRDWGLAAGGTTGSLQVTGFEPLGPSSRKTALAISEIMYNPAARADGKNPEFIELFNSDPIDADVGGFQISGEVSYTIPDGTLIPGGGFLVIATTPAHVQSVYGLTGVLGPLSKKLPNGSAVIRLCNKQGAILLETEYDDEDPWPVAADGAGPSLTLARASYGEGDARAWAASRYVGGSPGSADPVFVTPYDAVKINEIVAHTDPPDYDYVELYNHSASALDLAGCILTDHPTNNKCVLPSGTMIGAGGFRVFTSNELGFALSQYGETVYLKSPGATSVLDTVLFAGMPNGAALGRYPDGAPGFHELKARTEGTNNTRTTLRIDDIVINEIMYHPISENDDDEYIELYNRGASNVNIGGWAFTKGVDYIFPADTIVAPGAYVVVARNVTNLTARYPQLSTTNTFGNYDGKLANSGERIVLAKLDDPLDTNGEAWVTIDEVAYGDGNDWGRGTDGDGTSLELTDSGSDNRLAHNWAGSIETNKSVWTTISTTGTVDNGSGAADELHVVMLNGGECLVDDVTVVQSGNRLTNGVFNTNIGGWLAQGHHRDSAWNPNGVAGGCLHVCAANDGDTGVNRIETDLSPALTIGVTASLSARVRWLSGHPEILFRTRGGHLEASGRMELPTNLGSPGLVNSRAKINAGPAIWEAVQSPVLPGADESVLISARISDTDTMASVTLRYRVDPSATTNTVNMLDDGTLGDAVARDGVYSAILPGRPEGTMVAYHIRAVDAGAAPGTNFYPLGAPGNEALVRFGEEEPVGNFGAYRIWLTQADVNRWANREPLDNDPLPGTFVYGSRRVIHNAGAYYRGSPFIRATFNSPTGNLCAYHLNLPDEDKFLGTDKFNLDSLEPARDNTSQREKICFWMASRIGLPFSHQRFVHMYVNGVRRGNIYGDSLQVSADYVESWFPEELGGEIFKIDDWFEFPTDAFSTNFVNYNATLEEFTTTGGALKKARYRWNWEKKSNKVLHDDYGQVLELVEAMNEADEENRTARVSALVDVDSWVGMFALRHAVGDWDGYGYSRGKNAFAYKPYEGRWKLMLWDLDFCLGNSDSHPVDTGIFADINDPVISNKFLAAAPFRRAYLQAVKRIAEEGMWGGDVNPVCEANYAALTANGVSAYAPSDLESWIGLRRSHLLSQVNVYEAPFVLSNNGGADFSTNRNFVLLQGTAPLAVKSLSINGLVYAPSWDSTSNWSVRVVLGSGSNTLTVVGLDADGNPVAGASDSIGAAFAGPDVSPFGNLMINEILYDPTNAGARYVEIFNASAHTAFDLRGMRLEGLESATIAESAIVEPGGYLVAAGNRLAFGATYGWDIPMVVCSNLLGSSGGTLRLIRMNGTNEDLVVDEVCYDDEAPWPEEAKGSGRSLQLIDPARDNDRVGNWAVSLVIPYTPGVSNSVSDSLPPFPSFRINEVMTVNSNFLADGAGDCDPWVELHNGRRNVLAVELHQAGSNDVDAWLDMELVSTGMVTLVATGSVWKFLDDGSDQGTNWSQPAFDDGAWASGPAELGYGDGDESTLVGYGPEETNRYITTYFRRAIEVKDGFACKELLLSLRFDDGAVAYLNGTEVYRTNMPSGPISNQTLTLSFADDANPFVDAAISPALLQPGTNMLAVEIHQCSPSSSDLSFDGTLVARFAMSCVATGATWRYLDDGSNPGTAWRANDYEDGAWESGAGPFGRGLGGEGTLISSNLVTAYFRKTFEMPEEYLLGPVLLRGCWDDGVVVYLNGSELLRDNLPAGAMASTTTASSAVGETAKTGTVEVALNPCVLAGNATSLNGYYLSDDYTNLGKWAFPETAAVTAGAFRLVWADSETNEAGAAEIHAGFRLSATGGCVALVHSNAGRLTIVDYVNYPAVGTNNSYGLYPDGIPWTWRLLVYPSPQSVNQQDAGAVAILINEWMPDNKTALKDPADGGYEDWFELYNAGVNPVNLSGYTMTDDLSTPTEWMFSNGVVIAAGGFLVVWADGEPQQCTNGLHSNFSLSKSGDTIALFNPSGTLVDSVSFGAQIIDISQGRWRDGQGSIANMAVYTPGAVNIVNRAPVLGAISNICIGPGSLLIIQAKADDPDVPEDLLTFQLEPGYPAGAGLQAATGIFQWTPSASQSSTTNLIGISVYDNRAQVLADTNFFTVVVRDSNSVFDAGVSPQAGAGGLAISWMAETGALYRIEYQTNLFGSAWSNLAGDMVASNSATAILDEAAGTEPMRFYRIQHIVGP